MDIVVVLGWSLFLGLLGGGLGCACMGLQGRRVDDHPYCRACGFDLFGLNLALPRGCPECGANLATSRAVKAGRYARRWGLVWIGLGLMWTYTGLVLWTVKTRFDWHRLQPTAWLIHQAEAGGPCGEHAYALALERAEDKDFSKDQAQAAFDAAMRLKANGRAWWQDMVGELNRQGLVDDMAYASFLRDPVAFRNLAVFSKLRLRSRVAPTNGMAIGYYHISHSGSANVENAELSIGGVPIPIIPAGAGWDFGIQVPAGSELHSVTPGVHEARLILHMTCTHYRSYKWHITLTDTVEIMPPEVPSSRAVDDPLLEPAMIKSIVRIKAMATEASPSSPWIQVELTVQEPPVGVACEVLIDIGQGPPLLLGTLAVAAGQTYAFSERRYLPRSIQASKGKLILRPQPGLAEYTFDVADVWTRELVIDNVPIER